MSPHGNIATVTVDLGGTWIRVLGVDSRGRRVRFLRTAGPAVKKLPDFLKHLLHKWSAFPEHLRIASKGVWSESERRRMAHAVKPLAHRVMVISDVEAAWLAAFGSLGAGILVISGTGSIAYGEDRRGGWARAGGRGPQIGDEGSGYWIGKEWLLAQGKIPKKRSVRDIAALAPVVLRQAQRGDLAARRIIREAQTHLVKLVEVVAHIMRWKGRISVSWAGSVLANARFRKGFVKGQTWSLIRPRLDAVSALARI